MDKTDKIEKPADCAFPMSLSIMCLAIGALLWLCGCVTEAGPGGLSTNAFCGAAAAGIFSIRFRMGW